MATLQVRFRQNGAKIIRYVFRHAKPEDPADSMNVPADPELAVDQFKAIRELHSFKGKKEVIHITQNWDKEESAKIGAAEINKMGMELVEKYFRGHQVLVVTHTETPHFHNHIVVNTMNMETGKQMWDKKIHLYKLRQINDEICLKRGLSIVNQKQRERERNLPEKVQRMIKFNKHSYLSETMDKADFARKYATSYDEYGAILSGLGINVRVENKNISYFYPGKGRPKRGSKLGKKYDKAFLEETFKKNDELFKSRPELRAALSGEMQLLKAVKGPSASKEKDYSAFTKASRDTQPPYYPSDRLKDSIIPLNEIKRARESSLFEYCKKNKISLIQNEKGVTVLKGREYVTITDREWINRRNRTRGTLIEFVAQHHDLNFLQAIAKINNNPRLLLLEKELGEQKRNYTSFYVPKQDVLDYPKSIEKVGHLLQSFGVNPKAADNLLKNQRVQVNKNGVIKFLPTGESTGALEFTRNESGGWSRKTQGSIQNPFFALKGTGKKALIFQDPFTFLKKYGTDAFSQRVRNHSVLVLMEPNSNEVDKFLGQHSHVKDAILIPSHDKPLSKTELDFFNVLKKRYTAVGIGFETTTIEKALKPEGRDLHI